MLAATRPVDGRSSSTWCSTRARRGTSASSPPYLGRKPVLAPPRESPRAGRARFEWSGRGTCKARPETAASREKRRGSRRSVRVRPPTRVVATAAAVSRPAHSCDLARASPCQVGEERSDEQQAPVVPVASCAAGAVCALWARSEATSSRRRTVRRGGSAPRPATGTCTSAVAPSRLAPQARSVRLGEERSDELQAPDRHRRVSWARGGPTPCVLDGKRRDELCVERLVRAVIAWPSPPVFPRRIERVPH